ncbi:MAG TPA: sugar ABC transporter permease [Candidatus Scybalocola faecavium]|nr:sugar ABC transporter permease [Candidatus Scybalocola faecavium]
MKKKAKNFVSDLRHNKILWIMLLPVIAYYIIFCYLPMFGIVIAFEDFSPALGVFKSRWVGLKNFVDFFSGIYAWRLIRNTFLMGLYDIAVNFTAPIIFALLLNEIGNKFFKRLSQTISYMPYFISVVVVCGLVINFTSSSGVISTFVAWIAGTTPENLLANPAYFRAINVLSGLWQGLGYGSIIYLAALSSVSQELYEAARIDGAGYFQQMLHITLPAIAPTIILMLIMRIGMIMGTGGDKILLLYSPATYETADVISTYTYRMAFDGAGNYGLSAAVGLFNSVINTILLLAANGISKKFSETSLF